MGISKYAVETFSQYVESYKKINRFEYFSESIIDIVNENIFDFIHIDNVYKFISPSLKEKMLLEYSHRNMIKEQYKRKYIELF